MSMTNRSALPAMALIAIAIATGPAATQAQQTKAMRPRAKGSAAPAAAKTSAQTKAASDGVELVGLQILKPKRPEPQPDGGGSGAMTMMMGGGMMGREGTTLHLSLTHSPRALIGFDGKASKLASATDDKATDLAKEEARPNIPQFRFGIGNDGPIVANIQPDGHHATLEVQLPRVPVKGATKILLKGQLVFQTGSGEKVVEQKDVSLKDGKITVGPVPMTFGAQQGGGFTPNFGAGGDNKPTTQVALNHTRPLGVIKKLVFLGPDGKEIAHNQTGSMTSGMGGQLAYTTLYSLEGKVDRATVRLTYYDKVEPLTLPLDVEAGVGF